MVAPAERDVQALARALHVLDPGEFGADRADRGDRGDDDQDENDEFSFVGRAGRTADRFVGRARDQDPQRHEVEGDAGLFHAMSRRVGSRQLPGQQEADDEGCREPEKQARMTQHHAHGPDAPARARGSS